MGENKNSSFSISVGALLVALLIIVLVLICKILVVDKNSDETEVKNNSVKIENSENIVDIEEENIDEEVSEDEELQLPEYLEGLFAYENSDVAYRFYKDGTVSLSGNVTEESGTYNIYKNGSIILTFTELITYDLEGGDDITSSINRTQVLKYVDENTLYLGEDTTYPIIRFPGL